MKRPLTPMLARLTPEHAAFLTETFARNKAIYGDDAFRMEDDPAPADPADPAPEPKEDPAPDPKPEPKEDPAPDPKPEPKPEPKEDPKPKTDEKSIAGLDEETQEYIRGLRSENKEHRTSNQTLKDQVAELSRVNQVLRLAPTLGGDITRLLDSKSVEAALKALDPEANDFASKAEAVLKAAIEKDTTLKSRTTPVKGGAPVHGAPDGGTGTRPRTSIAAAIAARNAG